MDRSFRLRAALLVVVPFARSSAQAVDHASFTGCYAVALGDWTPTLADEATYHAVPTHIRLDTAGRLSPNIAYPYPRGFQPKWSVQADTLTLRWSNGFAPTTIKVSRRDSVLVGVAVARSDAIPLGRPHWPQAPATLRREACRSR